MVECHFYAVQWDDLTRRLAEAEDTEDVVEHIAEQQVGPSDPSKSRQMDFIEAYKAFARSWESPSREPFEALFHGLFWDWVDGGQPTLDVPEEQAEGFDVVWSPDTVRRHAEEWARVDLDSAREAFERHVTDECFDGFDDWAAFAREHGDMLRRAADEGKGIAEYVFG